MKSILLTLGFITFCSLSQAQIVAEPGTLLWGGYDGIADRATDADTVIRMEDMERTAVINGRRLAEFSLSFDGYVAVNTCGNGSENGVAVQKVALPLPVTAVMTGDPSSYSITSVRFFVNENNTVLAKVGSEMMPIGTVGTTMAGYFLKKGSAHNFTLSGRLDGDCKRGISAKDFARALPVVMQIKRLSR